nr:malonate decarboxylase holo-ACP synthase [Paraburkholderia humisilvae]
MKAAGGRDGGEAGWRPHDVVRLSRLPKFDGEPVWVRDAFLYAPFAVVRRAQAASGFVAIGIRGAKRAQRYGTWVEHEDVEFALAPEALLTHAPLPGREQLPAFSALAALRRAPGCLAQFVWGPAGSVGFELATGRSTATATSDLDLLIRTPDKLHHTAVERLLAELLAHAQRAGIRVDAQLETPAGGVALAELAAGKPHVMARAADGASLVDDPWVKAADRSSGATARPDTAVTGAER